MLIWSGNSLQFLLVAPKDGFINLELRLDDSTRPHSDSQNICLSGNIVQSDDSIYVRKETAGGGDFSKSLIRYKKGMKLICKHLPVEMSGEYKLKIRVHLKPFNKKNFRLCDAFTSCCPFSSIDGSVQAHVAIREVILHI